MQQISNGDTMSFWEKELNQEATPSLKKDIEVDTLIIGGGITGLTTLYYLKEKENIALVDASLIGLGVTTNTTGKLTYLQDTIYSDLINNIHYDTAKKYLKSQKWAIQLAKTIIEKEKINCHFEKVRSYVFTNEKKSIKKLKQERYFLTAQNIEVQERKLPLKIPHLTAISIEDSYVFHPILYTNALKKMLKNKIYENTKITKIKRQNDKYICYSNQAKITAAKVIVATHYPIFLLPFCLPLKSYIEKSYIMVRKVKNNPKFSCISIDKPVISIRYYEDKKGVYEFCLSASHKTSKNQNDAQNFKKIQNIFNCQEKEICNTWSNVDVITDDKLPYIGEVKNNFYLATGFNTWGMTNAFLAAYIISKKIMGENPPFANLFSLKRKNIYQIKNFFPNLLNTILAYIGSKIKKKEKYPNIVYTKRKGKKIAIYKEENGNKKIVYTTCPHMGCDLHFNSIEQTWDCPCHSSRFDVEGHAIKGPTTKDICYKE